MKYHFKIHKSKEGGYWAQCVELDGCVTQAETKAELEKGMKEALNLFLSEPESSTVVFPMPDRKLAKAKGVVEVVLSPSVAFALLVRQARLERKMTQRQVAEALGCGLYSYQRLEKVKTANPELHTIAKIHSLFPEINLDKIIA